MNQTLIRVIIPVYKAEKYLKRCLNSLLNQSFTVAYEIILVNDGSPDHSVDICEQYVREYSNIKRVNKKQAITALIQNPSLKAIRKTDCLLSV